MTNPPPKAMNIFSAFSLVHYARKWRKMSKRRFKITRDMYEPSAPSQVACAASLSQALEQPPEPPQGSQAPFGDPYCRVSGSASTNPVHSYAPSSSIDAPRLCCTPHRYGDSGNKAGGGPTLVPTITKAPEVKAMLWTAIQANDMLRSMDESTVLRMLMAMARVDFAAGATVRL